MSLDELKNMPTNSLTLLKQLELNFPPLEHRLDSVIHRLQLVIKSPTRWPVWEGTEASCQEELEADASMVVKSSGL